MKRNLGWCLLVGLIVLVMGACRPVEQSSEMETEPSTEVQSSSTLTPTAEAAVVSPLNSPLASPLVTPAASDALRSPLPVDAGASLDRGPANLVILHTNDTWGYYDPCG